jgi:hypothetical protein
VYKTGWSGGKATGETERAKKKTPESWGEKSDDSTDRQKNTAMWKWSRGNPNGN